MSLLFKCPRCGRSGFVTPPKVRCSCGLVCADECFTANTDPSVTSPARAPELPCLHRGQPVRKLDCGCEGNATVYVCGVRDQCLLRPLPISTFRGATCDGCDVRRDPRTSTAIITTHFNPWSRQRLRDTYAQWAEQLGHPHVCYELAFGEPEIPGSVVVRGEWENVLWQKERLLNLAVSRLPADVQFVAWVDHDLVFANPDWLDIGCDMIRRGVDAVQLFDAVDFLDPAGQVIRRNRGSVAAMRTSGDVANSSPGGAWIASRAWLDQIGGIYDRNICGGGDATFLHAVAGCETSYLNRQAPKLRADCLAYAASVTATAGYVPGVVRHLWHGDKSNRQYHSRDAILRQYDFDPHAHLVINPDGILELTPAAPAGLSAAIAAYFRARRDDG